jgi:putative phosphoesterase
MVLRKMSVQKFLKKMVQINLQNKESIVVGVISDTHGLLIPTALKALKDVDLIIHAGDIGNADVLYELKRIAPVVAVRGNMDMSNGLKNLPETEAVEVGNVFVYVIHDIQKLDIVPSGAGFKAVIFGHFHRPSVSEEDGVLYLNPGSAAQPRRDYPASIALLHIRGESIKAEIVDIGM